MNDFDNGGVAGAHLNGNGKNNNGLRSNKPTTNEISRVGNPATPNGNPILPSVPANTNTSANGNSNGNVVNRKPTNNLSPITVLPPVNLSLARRNPTDPLLPDKPRNPSSQIVLTGTLAAFSPSSLLSLLNIQKQVGTLHLNNNVTTGYIYIEKGEVWDARLGSVVGAYALFQLFGWKQGQFSFEVGGPSPSKRTIEASLPVLQVRATLWLDNMNKYNQLIPSVSHRIVIANDPSGGVVIEPYQWAILTKIVARPLSIAQLAEELDQDLMTVTRIAADLVRMGIATVKPPETSQEGHNNNSSNARG